MLRRLTSGWTDLHPSLVTSFLVVGTLTWTSAGIGGQAGPAVVLVMALTALVALCFDAMTGLVTGLAGAAGCLAATRLLGGTDATFATQAGIAGLVLLLGTIAGSTGDRIRRGRRLAARTAAGAVAPVPGSLGLMSTEDAHERLDEEITRARLHARPLSASTLRVLIHDPGLSPEDIRRARRAVARVLESELRATDIPFVSLAEGEFGVIMPETDAEAGADVLESVLILAREATFADRATGQRRHVGDVAVVQVGITDAADAEGCPRAVLDASRDEMVELPAWSA